MCEEEDAGGRQEEKERRQIWHRSKEGQVSAPLIIDPTAGGLAKIVSNPSWSGILTE